MQNPSDVLLVSGNAVFDGGNELGLMTDGATTIGGEEQVAHRHRRAAHQETVVRYGRGDRAGEAEPVERAGAGFAIEVAVELAARGVVRNNFV